MLVWMWFVNEYEWSVLCWKVKGWVVECFFGGCSDSIVFIGVVVINCVYINIIW